MLRREKREKKKNKGRLEKENRVFCLETYFTTIIQSYIGVDNFRTVYRSGHDESDVFSRTFEPLRNGRGYIQLHPATLSSRLSHPPRYNRRCSWRVRPIVRLEHLVELHVENRRRFLVRATNVQVQGGVAHVVFGRAVRKLKVQDVVPFRAVPQSRIWNKKKKNRRIEENGSDVSNFEARQQNSRLRVKKTIAAVAA